MNKTAPKPQTEQAKRQWRQFAAVLRKHGIAWDQRTEGKGERK